MINLSPPPRCPYPGASCQAKASPTTAMECSASGVAAPLPTTEPAPERNE